MELAGGFVTCWHVEKKSSARTELSTVIVDLIFDGQRKRDSQMELFYMNLKEKREWTPCQGFSPACPDQARTRKRTISRERALSLWMVP